MNQTEANRLATMYHFIKEMPASKLEMDDIVSDGNCNTEKELVVEIFDEKCGTAGCMSGLSPALFPRRYKYFKPRFSDGWSVGFRNKPGYRAYEEILSDAFGITLGEACDLGAPTCTTPEKSKERALTRMRKIAAKYGWDIEHATRM